MPRKNVTYTCELCRKEYENLSDAEQCEKSHKIPKEVRSPRYSPADPKKVYPKSVLVEFTDGTSARYHRVRMHQDA